MKKTVNPAASSPSFELLPSGSDSEAECCDAKASDDDSGEDKENMTNVLFREQTRQPFCPITIKNTKEIAGFNALAEALLRLDFKNAVRDIRRFNYVAKLMFMLLSHEKLSHLSGAAQRILFRLLEDMAETVYENNQNQHVLRKLMEELHATMTVYHVWGSHLGSTNLFKQHLESRRKITEIVEKMQVQYKQDLASTPSSPGLVESLPEECIREILLRLSDASDLDRSADACTTMNNITRENRVWRELVQTHFTKPQIEFILSSNPSLRERKDWRLLYRKLRRKFGLREEFTELLILCKNCRVLFWQSYGHPCLVRKKENRNEALVPVTPQTFLSFFSV